MRHDDDDTVLRDGEYVRVPLMMRDGDDDGDNFLTDSDGRVLTDAFGEPLFTKYNRRGFVYIDADRSVREENYQLRKAELSNAWKGGLQDGDHVDIDGRNMEVIGRNVDNGKLVLADTAELDADDIKRTAYNDGVAAMNDAWRTRPTTDAEPGNACRTSEGQSGKWRRGSNGQLVCRADNEREPSDNEWAMSGPLSDSQCDEIKEQAWRDSCEALENAWRR